MRRENGNRFENVARNIDNVRASGDLTMSASKRDDLITSRVIQRDETGVHRREERASRVVRSRFPHRERNSFRFRERRCEGNDYAAHGNNRIADGDLVRTYVRAETAINPCD